MLIIVSAKTQKLENYPLFMSNRFSDIKQLNDEIRRNKRWKLKEVPTFFFIEEEIDKKIIYLCC